MATPSYTGFLVGLESNRTARINSSGTVEWIIEDLVGDAWTGVIDDAGGAMIASVLQKPAPGLMRPSSAVVLTRVEASGAVAWSIESAAEIARAPAGVIALPDGGGILILTAADIPLEVIRVSASGDIMWSLQSASWQRHYESLSVQRLMSFYVESDRELHLSMHYTGANLFNAISHVALDLNTGEAIKVGPAIQVHLDSVAKGIGSLWIGYRSEITPTSGMSGSFSGSTRGELVLLR